MEYKLTLYVESNKTRQDLLNDVDNAWDKVKEYEETFKLYSIANPKDITPTNLDPVGYLQREVGEQLEFYREAVVSWRRALDFLDAYDDYQDELKKTESMGAKLYKCSHEFVDKFGVHECQKCGIEYNQQEGEK